MRQLLLLFLFLFFGMGAAAQKAARIQFCGAVYKNKAKMQEQLDDQFQFFQLNEKDTVVDIGAGSGWVEGAFAAVSPLSNLHFVLVDIDTICLNRQKLGNMIDHYSKLKGAPITHTFELVNNTPDSLYLASNKYQKAWLLNVLHEVPDNIKMVVDLERILRSGGELVLLEMIPRQDGQLHGGCKKPLMSPAAWQKIFEANGFTLVQFKEIKRRSSSNVGLFRFRKN